MDSPFMILDTLEPRHPSQNLTPIFRSLAETTVYISEKMLKSTGTYPFCSLYEKWLNFRSCVYVVALATSLAEVNGGIDHTVGP